MNPPIRKPLGQYDDIPRSVMIRAMQLAGEDWREGPSLGTTRPNAGWLRRARRELAAHRAARSERHSA